MIIEMPDDNSIVKWKKNDNEDWKSAEISDLIKAYEERPNGRWIIEDAIHCLYYCSNCRNNGERILPYCPWCGAKMKGGAE